MGQKKNIKLTLTIFVIIVVALVLPRMGITGSLEPLDPPGPTMKTLDQIPPTWSQKLQCDTTACPRFEIVMDGEAVLDKETGLVWQRTPNNYDLTWYSAQWSCWASLTGRRSGWRLPTIQELESLMDYSKPFWESCWSHLPCGHPFVNLRGFYWSSTTWFFDSNEALALSNAGSGAIDKSINGDIWCVRGGFGINVNE
jgi:hypothetical protein